MDTVYLENTVAPTEKNLSFRVRLIKFLFTGCLLRNQSDSGLKMFLEFVSEILANTVHY